MKTMVTALLLALLCLQASCKKSEDSGDGSAGKDDKVPQRLAESMFAGTSLAKSAPGSIDFSSDGKLLFVRTKLPGDKTYRFMCFEVADGKLGVMNQLGESPEYNRDFLDGHPTKKKCLAIVTKQEEGRIVDHIAELAGDVTPLGYLRTPGLPADLPQTVFNGLSPFYSASGDDVIIPLKERGLIVFTPSRNASQYVDFPAVDFVPTGREFGALPASGRGYVFCAQWSIPGSRDEKSKVSLLNLDTFKWELESNPPWVVYRIGSADPALDLWLAAGSRPPEINVEHDRVPRLGFLDPASAMADLIELNGEPVWDVLLDPAGKHVTYLDKTRSAVVRYNPQTGVLEFDKNAFDPKASLHYCPQSSDVFVWNKTSLMRADFTGKEQLEPAGV